MRPRTDEKACRATSQDRMRHSLTSIRIITAAVPHCPKCGSGRYRASRGLLGALYKSLTCRGCGEDIVAASRAQGEASRFRALPVALGLVGVVAAFSLVVASMQVHGS